jgi:hypothetical protein
MDTAVHLDLVARIRALCVAARADHETHDPAPAVHVEDLEAALEGAPA